MKERKETIRNKNRKNRDVKKFEKRNKEEEEK